MTQELNTYEEYVATMKRDIQSLMEMLYPFKMTKEHNGIYECSKLSGLIMDLRFGSDHFIENVKDNPHQLIEQWIDLIEVEKLDCLFLVAFLRTNFLIRRELKNWIALRDKTAIKLDSEGHDSERVLIGLYK